MFAQAGGLETHRSGCTVPPGYGALLDAAVTVFERDQRVRAAWVHGSLARGDADAVSDLDLIVAVDDAELAAFAEGWRERLNEITPTVMARPSFGNTGSWLAITPSCQRFDLWSEPASGTAHSVVRDRHPLFDRDGLSELVPDPESPPGPSSAKFDQIRTAYANALAVAAVADELLQIEVVHALRWSLYEAFVESNRPLPTTGLKQWSAKLTDAQRQIFERLPTRGDPEPLSQALEGVLGDAPTEAVEPSLAHVVIPPEGLIRGLTVGGVPPGTWARHIAEEFLAIHLYLTVVAHREDWLLGVEGISLQRKLLYELDLEENGRRPADSPSVWSGRLTSSQQDELLDLPTGQATRDEVVDAYRAIREAFVRRGRRVVGADWPEEMERAICDHVDNFLHTEPVPETPEPCG